MKIPTCFRRGCKNPRRDHSKYCSDACRKLQGKQPTTQTRFNTSACEARRQAKKRQASWQERRARIIEKYGVKYG